MVNETEEKGIGGKIFPEGSTIIQVGIYPPPYGGISMRIKRMSKLINKAGAKSFVFSPRQRAIHSDMISFRRYIGIILRNLFHKRRKQLLVHLQHSDLQTFRAKWYAFIKLVRLCGASVVVSLGGLLHDINKLPPLKRFFFKCVTNQIDSYVAVGQEIADKLIKGGCPKKKVSIIPGFTPPDEEELFDPKSISVDLEWFLEKHNPIIMANASGVVFCNGRDLYGLDMCVQLASRLRGHFANLGFIYAIAPGGHGTMDDWDYVERMRGMSREKNVESHFYFRICSEPLTPLLRRCDVFVRPTCTDGDSNSVREALYLGKPVAASDTVSRPEGCLIFRDGDINDFVEKVVMILSDYGSHRRRIQELKASFPHRELLRLYARVLSL